MSLGIIMLAHDAMNRVAQVARHWAERGCPVVIHIDSKVRRAEFNILKMALADRDDVRFCQRQHCEWGTWSLVSATQTAAEMMLSEFPSVRHVYLTSGSCLPLRPVGELVAYLDARPRTDFIESVTTRDVPWAVGGLDSERFTLRFPFSWKRSRRLFDGYVLLQRKLGVRRRAPEGLAPHLGSQWWCLTRKTLSAILEDPRRKEFDRYFSRTWIPDESYFQTLARNYSTDIHSRSLTLSKFDFQGKPHIFYDDHLQLLRRSDCFVARKVWPFADRLYDAFLTPSPAQASRPEPNVARIDRIFAKAIERRTRGRPGLYMQSRVPDPGFENGRTAHPYSVFEGFSEVMEDFPDWLQQQIGGQVHGHIFAPDRAEFSGGEEILPGCLSNSAGLRDHDPIHFLTNLIWNARGQRQSFQYGPQDVADIDWFIAGDVNARISVITGAWAVGLFHSNQNFSEIRERAAIYQQRESAHLSVLRSAHTKAQFKVWSLTDFAEAPMEVLQSVLDDHPQQTGFLTEAPRMRDLRGFGKFAQALRNQGLKLHLIGDFPEDDIEFHRRRDHRRPYIVQ